MNVVIAMDSFKGSLSSVEAGSAVKEAVLALQPSADVSLFSLADGGEGTVDAFLASCPSKEVKVTVLGPRLAETEATYAILEDGTAVIEVASAVGITLLTQDERNPMETTTFGVGQLLLDAIKRGCRRFLIGLGGSSTNDGGFGMLSALGYEFLDEKGDAIPLGAKGLERLKEIRFDHVCSALKECEFILASDVVNPLCGENGCSAVFGPQKGATAEMVEKMDAWLHLYAELFRKAGIPTSPSAKGAGAAGGLGFAFLLLPNAKLRSGIEVVCESIGLEGKVKNADIVVTGEGKMDAQTAMGKAPVGVAKIAKKYGKTVVALCGCAEYGAEICNEYGIDAYFPVLQQVCDLETALDPKNAYKNIKTTALQMFRLWMTK